MTVSQDTIPADGTTIDVNVAATEADGAVGAGSVTFTVPGGLLDGQDTKESMVDLSNGRATIKWSCAADSCLGT